MKNKLFAEMAEVMFGKDGRRWPEAGGTLVAVWKVIHADQYRMDEWLPVESINRYCRGYSKYPRRLRKRYLQTDGMVELCSNMQLLVDSSTSLARAQRIQLEVHNWLQGVEMPEAERARIEKCYSMENAGLDEIATYLASVLHYVIVVS